MASLLMEATIYELYNAGHFVYSKDIVSVVKTMDLLWQGSEYYIYGIDIDDDRIFVQFVVMGNKVLVCDVCLNHDIEFSRFNEWLNEQDQLSADMVCPLLPRWVKKQVAK